MDQQQLELMWAYQQEDMKADRIANEIRRSPTRQKLEKSRDFIMEQQKLYKQIDEQIAVLADRKDAIHDAIARCEEQLNALAAKVKANPPEDAESARALLQEVSKVRDTIASYEQEMSRIAKDFENSDRKQRSLRLEAAKAKQSFDQLKVVYEKESKEKKAMLDAQRAIAEEKAKSVARELMDEYLAIKKHIAPPMARLLGDQCSGCNTAQPSALLRKIKSGTVLVECETCGRMIIQ
ncbi:MAG: hypothetical protein IJ507_08260 [Clostridia bacterium]|nr:hypothetical protein [Clostridia bacterium]